MNHRTVFCAIASVVLTMIPQARAATIFDDDFADGAVGSQWATVADNPARLNLNEGSGRLNLSATPGGSANDDALYLSQFRLSTASDFVIRLDYAFVGYTNAGPAGTAVGLVFGVGRDLDGTDSAAIGQGVGTVDVFGTSLTSFAGTVAYRTDDLTTTAVTNPFNAQTGTFQISYDSAGDDLTLQRVGGGISYTLSDTVRAVWGATDLLVSFGGRGSGFGITDGQAYVDNFTIVTGTIVPEPTAIMLGLVGYGLAIRRRRV